jgi:hypothetical protein
LFEEQCGKVVALKGMDIVDYDFEEALNMKKTVSNKRYGLVGKLTK